MIITKLTTLLRRIIRRKLVQRKLDLHSDRRSVIEPHMFKYIYYMEVFLLQIIIKINYFIYKLTHKSILNCC